MDRFYFEEPSITRKEDAIAYINEFYEFGSDINGTGGLHRYLDDYEVWLEKLNEDYSRVPNEEKVPARTYFLVRESDKRIVGMINIRLALNERLKHYGGHIGYSIRPMNTGESSVGMQKTPDGQIFFCMKNHLSLDSPLRGASRIRVEERRLIRC